MEVIRLEDILLQLLQRLLVRRRLFDQVFEGGIELLAVLGVTLVVGVDGVVADLMGVVSEVA